MGPLNAEKCASFRLNEGGTLDDAVYLQSEKAFDDGLLNRESCFDSLVNIPPVHDREDPHFIFDDPKHHAIVSDPEFPITL